jgi:Tol biopolymer transport system component
VIRTKTYLLAAALLGSAMPSHAGAQKGLPLTPNRPLKFTTSEGTWISLDVSPDGRTGVFDLLGDLYTLPITGGPATRITSGQAFDAMPRYSPDGRWIAYVTDRDGSDNIWVVRADGTGPRQVTRTEWLGYVSPEWTPDGKFIVVSRNSYFGRSFAYYQPFNLWQYHVEGGTGQQITNRSGGAAGRGSGSYYGPAFTPDGKYIFAAIGNAGPHSYQLAMVDRTSGESYTRSSEPGGVVRPAVSPDGKHVAFGSRIDAKMHLIIRDLKSGDQRVLARDVQRDQAENFAIERDIMPGYAFTPDGRAIVIAHHGKIWSIDVASGNASEIPFTAEVDQMMGPALRFDYAIDDANLTVRQIRDPHVSPDGKKLAFVALDKLYLMDYPSGTPKRVTRLDGAEGFPAWSPDGEYVAFVRRVGKDTGGIYRVRANDSCIGQQAGCEPERLSRDPGLYTAIVYTRDGGRIVAVSAPLTPSEERGRYSSDLVWIPANGGSTTMIGEGIGGGMPHVGPDSSRIYIDGYEGLVSFRLDGTEKRSHLKVISMPAAHSGEETSTRILISPTGEHAIAVNELNVYLINLGVAPADLKVDVTAPDSGAVPFRKITRVAADFPSWNPDGKSFTYALGSSFFSYDVEKGIAAVRDSGSVPKYEPIRTAISITVPKDRPEGVVVLRGARIITMRGNEIIEKGDIVVRNNRIAAVGARGKVAVPSGARVIDVSGKTIIPGYIDLHAHPFLLSSSMPGGLHNTQPWALAVNLAYGVTTMRDPQTSGSDIFDYADRVDIGDMVGPRIYSVGKGIFVDDEINSLEDARNVMRRYSEYYKSETVKHYLAGDRKRRQWIAQAAAEQRISPTNEAGLQEKMTLTFMLDGLAGLEHSFSIFPLYKDVIELQAKSGSVYTPTLSVAYGGPSAEAYWVEHYDMHADPKLKRFWPHEYIDSKSLRWHSWARESEYMWTNAGREAAKFVEAGGLVGMGSHGQIQGIGAQFELWSFAMSGVKPHDVLKIATINGAMAIGHAKDLGSLEVGKLADLQVLDGNPLTNIRNTNKIKYVMKNGRLYDANTLNEVWPKPIKHNLSVTE